LLDAVGDFLRDYDEVVVSVRKLWKDLQLDQKFKDIEIPDFTGFVEMLKNDERFEFMAPMNFAEIYQSLGEEKKKDREHEMESIGLYGGERVKLKETKLTDELLAEMIEKSVNRMMNALKNAWEKRPQNKDAENRLIEIMRKAEQVKKELDGVIQKLKNKIS